MTAEAAREGLRQGEIDLALGFIASPMAERASPRGLEADMEHGVYSLVVNADRPPFNQRELRHALGMAIDREGLIKALKLAATTAAYNVVPPGVANYTPYRAPYAKLAPADRRVVAGALLLDIDPRAVAPIRLAHPAGRPHAAIAEGVAKAWHELGFRVTPLARGEADHEAALLAGDFDVAVVGHRSPLGDMEGYLHAFSQIAGPSNLARYRETSYDQRLAQADVQDNADYRISHLREAEGILIEDQIPWPLFFFAAPPLARDQLTGLVVNAAGAHVLRFIAAE
jgi:oligopeptide transport system substrate-binding protein